MITQRMSLRTEVIYSDDLNHRYLMRKEWDKNKPKATIIMITPSSATEIEINQTTMNVINNLNRLGYGAVDITNLCSLISPKISYRLSFFANFNSHCAHGRGYCHHGHNFIIRLHFIAGAYTNEIFYQNT